MSREFDDDSPGYGKPPPWTRFRKGQSGNPKGRPKKLSTTKAESIGQSSSDDVTRAVLTRKVKVVEGGVSKTLTILEAAARAQAAAALKGNVIAQRELLRQARELEARDAMRASEAEAEKQNDYNLIKDWKHRLEKEWARARETGVSPEKEFPHPDDILLYPDTHAWTIRGPYDAGDLPRFEYYRAQRDFLFAMAAFDARRRNKPYKIQAFDILWVSYDARLPLKWQVANDHLETALRIFDQLPLRDLRAAIIRYQKKLEAMPTPFVDRAAQKYAYQEASKVMQPLLKAQGYRSLAQFEHAWETCGDDLPWPKIAKI